HVRGRDLRRVRDEDHRALPAYADREHDREHGLMPVTRRINVDLPLVIVACALTLYGLAIVFSAGQTDVKTVAQGAYRLQAIWTCVGILGAFAVSRASVRLIEWMTLPA